MTYNYKYIFALDPSGNFEEGKGTTGWVLMDCNENLLERGYITAVDYRCAEEYWQAHVDLLFKYKKLYRNQIIVVMEDYILYRNRAENQTNSKIETCRLLGVLQWQCWRLNLPYTMQLASAVKTRWSDDILLEEGIIKRKGRKIFHVKSDKDISLEHTRDAFRHAIHYIIIRNKRSQASKRYKKIKNGYFIKARY